MNNDEPKTWNEKSPNNYFVQNILEYMFLFLKYAIKKSVELFERRWIITHSMKGLLAKTNAAQCRRRTLDACVRISFEIL